MRHWLGFAGYYVCSFAVLGVFMQFFPAWLHDVQGFGKSDIAVILSALTISRTLAGPLWSQSVDRTGDARRVLLWLSTGGIGVFALFAFAPSMAAAWSVAFLFGCLYPPMHSIADAAAVRAASRQGFSFGRLRVAGSCSFLVSIVLVGAYLDHAGTEQVFWVLMVALTLTAAVAWFVPRDPYHQAQALDDRTSLRSLFHSKSFVVLLISSALIQGSHATYYQLSTVYWSSHGIDKSMAAVLWAEGVLAEIIVMFFAKYSLDRWRPTTLMILGGGGAMVRWAVLASTTSVPLLLAANWLHGLSFAATYLGALRVVENRIPLNQRATAQGLLGAAWGGFGMLFCGLTGGFAFEAFEGGAFFFMAGFAGLGVLLALWLRRLRP